MIWKNLRMREKKMRTSNWIFKKGNKKMPRLVVPFKDKPKKNREELESEIAAFLKKGGKIQHLPTYAESREAE